MKRLLWGAGLIAFGVVGMYAVGATGSGGGGAETTGMNLMGIAFILVGLWVVFGGMIIRWFRRRSV